MVGFAKKARRGAAPSQRIEADSTDAYGRYLEPSHVDKEVSAIQRIVANWYEVMIGPKRTDHAPLVLRLNNADARFRHLLFCLETVYYFSVANMADEAKQQAIARESCAGMIRFAMSYRGEGQIFDEAVDPEKLSAQASAHLHCFSSGWAAYMQHRKGQKGKGRTEETAGRISAMLRYVENESSLGSDDAERLRPLACWIEDGLISLEPSFVELTQ